MAFAQQVTTALVVQSQALKKFVSLGSNVLLAQVLLSIVIKLANIKINTSRMAARTVPQVMNVQTRPSSDANHKMIQYFLTTVLETLKQEPTALLDHSLTSTEQLLLTVALTALQVITVLRQLHKTLPIRARL